MDRHTDLRALAVAYIEAVGRKEFDQVAEWLHPDVEFVTTGPSIRGRSAFVGALRRLGPILVGNEIRSTIVDGNDVAIVYHFVTDTPAGPVPTIEWITFDDRR